jgi:hypothetical protein
MRCEAQDKWKMCRLFVSLFVVWCCDWCFNHRPFHQLTSRKERARGQADGSASQQRIPSSAGNIDRRIRLESAGHERSCPGSGESAPKPPPHPQKRNKSKVVHLLLDVGAYLYRRSIFINPPGPPPDLFFFRAIYSCMHSPTTRSCPPPTTPLLSVCVFQMLLSPCFVRETNACLSVHIHFSHPGPAPPYAARPRCLEPNKLSPPPTPSSMLRRGKGAQAPSHTHITPSHHIDTSHIATLHAPHATQIPTPLLIYSHPRAGRNRLLLLPRRGGQPGAGRACRGACASPPP